MANFNHVEETLGSIGGRNFSTMLAYLLALPNPFVNEVRDLSVFADSDFDESNLVIQPPTVPTDSANLMIHNALGELPVFKPASGSNINIFNLGQQMAVVGLTADGVNLTGTSNGFSSSSTLINMMGCVARNMPLDGFTQIGGQPVLYLYCLADNCTGNGWGGIHGPNSAAIGCGAAGNAIGFKGRSATIKMNLQACWALDNTTDIDDASTNFFRKFIFIGDTSIPAGDDIFRSQVPADLGFVNFAGRDYRLEATSILIAKGFPLWNRESGVANPALLAAYYQAAVQDAFARQIAFDFGVRMNIGPFQPTFKALKTGGRLIVLGIL